MSGGKGPVDDVFIDDDGDGVLGHTGGEVEEGEPLPLVVVAVGLGLECGVVGGGLGVEDGHVGAGDGGGNEDGAETGDGLVGLDGALGAALPGGVPGGMGGRAEALDAGGETGVVLGAEVLAGHVEPLGEVPGGGVGLAREG